MGRTTTASFRPQLRFRFRRIANDNQTHSTSLDGARKENAMNDLSCRNTDKRAWWWLVIQGLGIKSILGRQMTTSLMDRTTEQMPTAD